MLVSINQLSWNPFDMKYPSLWQINYLEQLKEQTGVTDLDLMFTRNDFGKAISSLKALRTHQRATKK